MKNNLEYAIHTESVDAYITREQWDAWGIHNAVIAFHLWVQRLGVDFLKSTYHVPSYFGQWSNIILDCSGFVYKPKQAVLMLKNELDGRIHMISEPDFFTMIAQIAPSAVLMPKECTWHAMDLNPIAFYYQGVTHQPSPYYIKIDTENTFSSDDFALNQQWGVVGSYDKSTQSLIATYAPCFQINTFPFDKARLFQIEENGEWVSLTHQKYAFDHNKLSEDCLCDTCSYGFTKAYFHHLMCQTPLLAHRLLATHHVCQMNFKVNLTPPT